METVHLSKPFKLQNGNEINEFHLQLDELSVGDFRQIKKLESMVSNVTGVDANDMAKPKNLTFEFQLASGFLAAVKGTEGLSINDFVRIPMIDSMAIAEVASFFWLDVD